MLLLARAPLNRITSCVILDHIHPLPMQLSLFYNGRWIFFFKIQGNVQLRATSALSSGRLSDMPCSQRRADSLVSLVTLRMSLRLLVSLPLASLLVKQAATNTSGPREPRDWRFWLGPPGITLTSGNKIFPTMQPALYPTIQPLSTNGTGENAVGSSP